MAEEITYLKKELEKVREILFRAENRLAVIERRYSKENEAKRIRKLKEELKRDYPNMRFTPRVLRLLRLVGTQPYNPISKDKEAIMEAITARYE
jgi:hypothetical protein